uniref:Uncharacterized protein n=1 Tax=Magallana gigas TaxID=29159 RepID=K1PCL0_MAGGI
MYKAPEIFSNTESPTNIRAKPPDTTNATTPSVPPKPVCRIIPNQLYDEILKHFGCLAVHITLAPDFYLYKAQAGRLWPNGISDPTSYH